MPTLDAKIAVITGTVFAGVLIAGALAAPLSGDDAVRDTTAVTAADESAIATGAEPDADASRVSRSDYEDDDDHDEEEDDDHGERDDDHDEEDDD